MNGPAFRNGVTIDTRTGAVTAASLTWRHQRALERIAVAVDDVEPGQRIPLEVSAGNRTRLRRARPGKSAFLYRRPGVGIMGAVRVCESGNRPLDEPLAGEPAFADLLTPCSGVERRKGGMRDGMATNLEQPIGGGLGQLRGRHRQVARAGRGNVEHLPQ